MGIKGLSMLVMIAVLMFLRAPTAIPGKLA
jgi:hypothetical protein